MRTTASVLAAVLLAGCSAGYRVATPAPSGPSAPPVATAAPTPRAIRTPMFPGALFCENDPVLGEGCQGDTDPPPRPDVDGDGLADAVTTVTRGDQNGLYWEWGLRATMTSLGTQTVWVECCPDGQSFDVVGDVDGDGDVEVAGVYGSTVMAGEHFLVTVHDRRLTIVRGPALWSGVYDGHDRIWSCVPGGVVLAAARYDLATATAGTSGTRTYYRLDGTRLVRTRVVNDRWGVGRARPAEYDRGLACG